MENLILNNGIYGIDSITPLFKEKEEKGVATISRIEISEDAARWENLRLLRDGGFMFRLKAGHYTRLHINNELMMSDTPMERLSNGDFVRNANGRVLIAGLGLGMIIKAILEQDNITEILVIEKYQDVIDLVAPKFNSSKLKIICADIDNFKLPKGDKYDTIYFDIWADISIENLEHIAKLHNKFKNSLNRNNPKRYMNSWMKEYLKQQRRKEARSSNWY